MYIKPRSHLYSLEPVYDRLPLSEGVGSFLGRLAIEHCLSTQNVIEEILFYLGEKPGYVFRREYASVLYVLNGMGAFAKKWIDAMEMLTARHDLKPLTLLNWDGIIRPIGLIREHKAWCSSCLSE
jgi:hypothetical protein